MIWRIEPFNTGNKFNNLERSAFARGPKERTLRIFVDEDSLEANHSSMIDGFGGNPHIDVTRINLSSITLDSSGSAHLDIDTKRFSFSPARHNLDTVISHGYEIDKTEQNIEQRLVLCMILSSTIGCDAFVTSSIQTFRIARAFWKMSNPLSYLDTMKHIGLHLRLREDFVYHQKRNSRIEIDGPTFYDLVAHDLLPQFWRWQTFLPTGQTPLEPSSQGLADAILTRFTRALRARDRVHGQLMRQPTAASIDESLFYFDGFLVAIASAFDAAARVVNNIFSLDKPHRSSWNNQDWTKKLINVDPDFGPLLLQESWIKDILGMIFPLRNSIHEETFKPIIVPDRFDSIRNFHIAIPQDDKDKISDIVKRRGGFARWGIHEIGKNALSIELGQYIERLLPLAAIALTKLMEVTKVERIGFNRGESVKRNEDHVRMIPHVRLLAGIEVPDSDSALPDQSFPAASSASELEG